MQKKIVQSQIYRIWWRIIRFGQICTNFKVKDAKEDRAITDIHEI